MTVFVNFKQILLSGTLSKLDFNKNDYFFVDGFFLLSLTNAELSLRVIKSVTIFHC